MENYMIKRFNSSNINDLSQLLYFYRRLKDISLKLICPDLKVSNSYIIQMENSKLNPKVNILINYINYLGLNLSFSISCSLPVDNHYSFSTNDLSILVQKLKEIRIKKGLKKYYITKQYDISNSKLKNFESGQSNFGLNFLLKLVNIYKIDLELVLSGIMLDKNYFIFLEGSSFITSDYFELIKALKLIRIKKDFKQCEIDKKMQKTYPITSKIETGEIIPTIKTMNDYIKTFGLTLYLTISHEVLPEETVSISTFNYTYLIVIFKKIRESKKLRLSDIAKLTSVSKFTISNIENYVNFPNIRFLISYAEALGAEIKFELTE